MTNKIVYFYRPYKKPLDKLILYIYDVICIKNIYKFHKKREGVKNK